MTATDELRDGLTKRGVEWRKPAEEYWVLLGMPEGDSTTIVGELSIEEALDGTLIVTGLTPEQAIAATLGRGECHDIGYRMDSTRFKCSQCGWDGWVRHAKDGRDYKPLWCPLCGAKVVDE